MAHRVAKLIDLHDGLAEPGTGYQPGATLVSPPEPALLTVTQAGRKLGVGQTELRRWIERGQIRAVSLGLTGRVKRIPAGEIERIRAHGISPAGVL